MTEQLYAFTYEMYGAGPEWYNTCQYCVQMRDEIDGACLNEALLMAMKRYPYLAMSLEKDEKEFRLTPNSRPVAVRSAKNAPELGSEEVNGHLMSVAYHGSLIYIDFFHVLMDGPGAYPFLKTLLYYYCTYFYHKDLSPEGINLANSPVLPQELTDPYPRSPLENVHPLGRAAVREAFCAPEKRADGFGTFHTIAIPSKNLMELVRSNDASPCVAFALMMARAVERVHPDPDVPVVGVMPKNVREVLGNPLAHNCPSVGMPLIHRPGLRHMDFARQLTCYRGMTTLQGDPENLLYAIDSNMKFFDRVALQQDLQARQEMTRKRVELGKQMRTFTISYAGKLDFGALEPFIQSIYPTVDVRGYGSVIEMLATEKYFFINLMHDFANHCYVKAFLKELSAASLPYVVQGPSPIRVASVRL